jgi:DNA-binding transcriptional LysR family regulator
MSSKRILSIKISDIEAFIAAAESRSHKEAAKKLGHHESTVSRAIINLETWSGLVLTTGDIPRKLTSIGEKYLPIAKQVVAMLENANSDLKIVGPPKAPRKSGRDIVINK